jgi:hypothetical protein
MFFFGLLYLPAVALGLALVGAPVPADDTQPPPVPKQEYEFLGRGPVNESYAEPVQTNPVPTPVIPRQPPAPLNEAVPDQKPDGDVEWVPGYWQWDDERKDFIWVSGCWRQVPPGRVWVPGEWVQVEGGWQWSPGYWAPEGQEQVTYLPPPPEDQAEEQQPAAPPSNDSLYVPGCHVYRQSQYIWRPGYYIDANPNWVWTPSCLRWTPAGYVFVNGYWDYPLARRGLLFGCLGFRPGFQFTGFNYVPSYVVAGRFLPTALFVRPAWGHYYYGDYFGAKYAGLGFQPWINYRVGRYAYDPVYAHYRATHPAERVRQLRTLYAGRARGTVPVPPHTFAQQASVLQGVGASQARYLRVLTQPRSWRSKPLVRLSAVDRNHYQGRVAEARRAGQVRRDTEIRLRQTGAAPLRAGRPARAPVGAFRPAPRTRSAVRTPARPRTPGSIVRQPGVAPYYRQARPGRSGGVRPAPTTRRAAPTAGRATGSPRRATAPAARRNPNPARRATPGATPRSPRPVARPAGSAPRAAPARAAPRPRPAQPRPPTSRPARAGSLPARGPAPQCRAPQARPAAARPAAPRGGNPREHRP